MLSFLFNGKLKRSNPSSVQDGQFSREQEMSLKYTEAAINLIEGKGGKAYLTGIARLLQKPSIREMVAPEYRLRLEEILPKKGG